MLIIPLVYVQWAVKLPGRNVVVEYRDEETQQIWLTKGYE